MKEHEKKNLSLDIEWTQWMSRFLSYSFLYFFILILHSSIYILKKKTLQTGLQPWKSNLMSSTLFCLLFNVSF
jgi:hypothetical protein